MSETQTTDATSQVSNGATNHNSPSVVEAAISLQQQVRSKLIIHAASRIQRLWRQYRFEVESTCTTNTDEANQVGRDEDHEKTQAMTNTMAHSSTAASASPVVSTAQHSGSVSSPNAKMAAQLQAAVRIEAAWQRYRRAIALERQLQREAMWIPNTEVTESEEEIEDETLAYVTENEMVSDQPEQSAQSARSVSPQVSSQSRVEINHRSASVGTGSAYAEGSSIVTLPLQLSHEDLDQMLEERENELEVEGLLSLSDDDKDVEEGNSGLGRGEGGSNNTPSQNLAQRRSENASASSYIPPNSLTESHHRSFDETKQRYHSDQHALIRATAAVLIQRALRQRIADKNNGTTRSATLTTQVNQNDNDKTMTPSSTNKVLPEEEEEEVAPSNNRGDVTLESSEAQPELPPPLENALRILQNRFRFGRLRRNLRARDLEEAARTVQELWRRRQTISGHYEEVARGRRDAAAREIQQLFRRRRQYSQQLATDSAAAPVSPSLSRIQIAPTDHVSNNRGRAVEPALVAGSLPLCVICMSAVVQVALLPCGHAHLCGECAACINRCPACRKRIALQIRIFL